MSTLAMRSAAPPGRLRLTLVLTTLMAFGAISTDMYLPALPALSTAFHVGQDRAQLTLSFFLLGFGLGQLIWGPMGDRYGRRYPVMAGIALHLIGSAGCALSGSIDQMIAWRFIQAFGACAAPVLARAMVRDLYGREQSARMLSILMLVMGVAPLVAPLLGGQVLLFGNWRDIFWVQAAFGLVGLFGVITVAETLPPQKRTSLRVVGAMFSYVELITNARFLGYALIGGAFYAGIFAYLAGTPFAYIAYYHVPPQFYGLLFALNIAGMMVANLVNSRLVLKLGFDKLLRIGTIIAAAAGTAVAIAGFTGFGGLLGLVCAVFFFVSMLGLVTANAMAGALAAFPHRAGTASALAGAVQFASGALSSAAVGWFADGTPWTMAWIMAAGGLCALSASLLLVRPAKPAAT